MLIVQIPHHFNAMYFPLGPLLLPYGQSVALGGPGYFYHQRVICWGGDRPCCSFFLNILGDYTFGNVLQPWLDRNVYYKFQVFLKYVLDFAILNYYFFLLAISAGDSRDNIPFFGCFILSQSVLMEWFSFGVNINALLFWDQVIQWSSDSVF